MFKDKVLMITGGTGSFGDSVLKRFIYSNVKEVRIFSRDEKKQDEIRIKLNNNKLKFYIGDVRDYGSIFHAMKGVDYVFHAAALKQVPSCEFYPLEATKTNILGSENVMNAAINCGVKRLVMLSTDKAVYPINAMGISKAMMEKLMIAKAREHNETVICATRYGNVMASRGSVIPLFVKQLKSDKPLTITDPNMTRFLMSLDDSVDLVMHAFEHGQPGDIFVQKSPASTINDLACALKDLFKKDNPLHEIGTRHGEKLFETLISREEMAKAEDMGNFYRIPADNRGLNYDQYFCEGEKSVSNEEDFTSHNAERLDVSQIKMLLLKLDYIKEQLDV
jgi:UDP-glucose 4-epimerase